MIRTRDFVLFLVVFVFLLMGTSLTLVSDLSDKKRQAYEDSRVAMVSGESLSVHQEADDQKRQSRLSELQKKLAEGEGTIIQGAPVLTAVDDEPEEVSETLDGEIDLVTDRSALYCDNIIENPVVFTWDARKVSMQNAEGARLVRMDEMTEVKVGTSTISTTATKTILQLPTNPRRLYTPTCLDSQYVGVSVDGSLIENNETWRYRSISSKSIIGYARDGHPIYGQGIDESKLDKCGGMMTPEGYRYHIRERELFVLGCFAASPASYID